MTAPVMNPESMEAYRTEPDAASRKFGADVRSFGKKMGLTGLGAMHVTVEPGKRAFPRHNHLGNDEMFVILEGEGTFIFGETSYEVRAGDVCAAPKGGPDTAHQIVNTGQVTLKYLGISTQNDPDVVEYPDSGKYLALAVAPGTSFAKAHLLALGRKEESLGYWDGEDLG